MSEMLGLRFEFRVGLEMAVTAELLVVSVPAAHKHGGKGATEARRVFGVELRAWKREQGDRFGG